MNQIKDTTLRLYDKEMDKVFVITLDYISNIIKFVNNLPDSEYKIDNLNQVTVFTTNEVYRDADINGVNFDQFFNQYNDISVEAKFYNKFKERAEGIIREKYPIFEKRKLTTIELHLCGELVFFFQVIDCPFFYVSIQSHHEKPSQFFFFDDELRVVKQAPLTINSKEFDVLAEKEWNRLRVKSHRIIKKLTNRGYDGRIR